MITVEKAKKLAKGRGGDCLSDVYIKGETLRWKCKNNHIWLEKYSIARDISWCPICPPKTKRKKKLSIEDAAEIAKERGGECLSNIYVNNRTYLSWKCSSGHLFSASLHAIKDSENWCPHCYTHTAEELCRNMLEFIFKYPFIKIRPIWLKNSNNNKLELDGYCKELNIAFEHQGDQHYTEIFKGKLLKHNVKQNDLEKRLICEKLNIKLIIINQIKNYKNYEELKLQIQKFCIDNNFIEYIPNIEGYIFDKNAMYNNNSKLKIIKDLAIIKNEECISQTYISSGFKLEFKCINNHIFKMTPSHYKNGHGCNYCLGKTKLTIENAKNLAIKNNLRCISEVYVDASSKLIWECNENKHEFLLSYDNLRIRPRCIVCHKNELMLNNRKNNDIKYKLIIEETCKIKNLKCIDDISKICVDKFTKINFICKSNHLFKMDIVRIMSADECCIQCYKIKNKEKYILLILKLINENILNWGQLIKMAGKSSQTFTATIKSLIENKLIFIKKGTGPEIIYVITELGKELLK